MHIHIQHTYICSIYVHSLSGLQLSTRLFPCISLVPLIQLESWRQAIPSWLWRQVQECNFGINCFDLPAQLSYAGRSNRGKLIPNEPGVRYSSRCEALAVQLPLGVTHVSRGTTRGCLTVVQVDPNWLVARLTSQC